MKHCKPTPPTQQRGITLIESLIALIVAALGILGIVGVQMRTLADSTTAVRRAQAIRLIEDLSERMKVNPNALLSIDSYVSDYSVKAAEYESADCTDSGSPCTASQLASYDLWQWKTTVEDTLPAGRASIFPAPGEAGATGNNRLLGVMVAWRENERADLDDGNLENIDNSKHFDDDGVAHMGTDTANACPEGFTCHLQYLPVSARCAPYGVGSDAKAYCS